MKRHECSEAGVETHVRARHGKWLLVPVLAAPCLMLALVIVRTVRTVRGALEYVEDRDSDAFHAFASGPVWAQELALLAAYQRSPNRLTLHLVELLGAEGKAGDWLLRRYVSSGTPVQKVRALATLSWRGEDHVDELIPFLWMGYSHENAAATAAMNLGVVGGERAVEPLGRAMLEEGVAVGGPAAIALIQIRSASARAWIERAVKEERLPGVAELRICEAAGLDTRSWDSMDAEEQVRVLRKVWTNVPCY